ncbi:ENTH-domain-containing protein [Gonapodya prolifera JEL478]|uniref:ENTH-domain-containing protein n=1 Tax=Gonapodya prolifera (strain JEL478) TaxID=1344416 RepID=A0A139AK14_GONPJ|nr:ENTH-domain-containing protein [Gonapodya prolifera JEL478]|eukprot:KXS16765.1 ENTH-domain-containing protein [Gonapodya prolifera JEL478]
MAQAARQVIRGTKNLVKGYSDVQVKVRQATSNDPWGPPGHLMGEIAEATNNHRDFLEIMEILDKRLNDSGKNWRHVFKALTLLDYLLHCGSEGVISYAKENLYVIKTLKEFQYIDEDGRDQGQNVRQKSKDIVDLLADEARLKEERKNRGRGYGGFSDYNGGRSSSPRGGSYLEDDRERDRERAARSQPNNDDAELQRALEESRRTAELDEKRRQDRDRVAKEEEDLQRAMQMSRDEDEGRRLQEEEYRRREEEEARRRQQMLQQQQYMQHSQGDFYGGGYGQMPQQQYQQPQPAFDPFAQMYASQQQNYGQQYNIQSQQLPQQQPQSGFNPFGQQNAFVSQQQGNPFGQSGTLPLTNQVTGPQTTTQATQLARNTAQIDPFANLATNRQQQGATYGANASASSLTASSANPFGATGAQQQQPVDVFGSASSLQQPAMQTTDFFNGQQQVQTNAAPSSNQNQWGIDSLVNLNPQALVSAPQQSSPSTFGSSNQSSKNPFQTASVASTGSQQWPGGQKGPSLLELQRQAQMPQGFQGSSPAGFAAYGGGSFIAGQPSAQSTFQQPAFGGAGQYSQQVQQASLF